ncbi:CBS domain-containing protein [uncultured Desulfobacter sp.]|uniref:CBS domain-containing protein n=1 Tax=uncultured Desulfobacter sp. TaxID=240139 RepID=UPI0029C9662C|nr:CBS domain-containing protein [uncultured Desulfobacter sp.]
MKVNDLIKGDTGHFYTVKGDQTVFHALQQMSAYGVSAVMVMADEMPAGIFTERDLIRCRILFPDKQTDQVTIDKVMTSKLIVAEPQDSVDAAMAMMIKARIRHLPVVGDGRPCQGPCRGIDPGTSLSEGLYNRSPGCGP